MDPVLVVSGIMLCLGSIYWWQLKMNAIAGLDGTQSSFACLVSAGMNNCPDYVADYLQQDNWMASMLFYLGIGVLIYSFTHIKPPPTPTNPL